MSGIFGAYSIEGGTVADELLIGTVSLQHRGEEGCGVSMNRNGKFYTVRDNQLAYYFFRDRFGNDDKTGLDGLREMRPNAAIGHTLYEASGGLQPIEVPVPEMNQVISLAMDGVLLGYMGKNDSVMRTMFSRYLDETSDICSATKKIMETFDGRGSYCVVALVRNSDDEVSLVAFRDPLGFKPYCLASKGKKYFVMSESKASDAIEADFIRDIEPGEVIIVSREGINSRKLVDRKHAHCFFEWIYFADPTSNIEGRNVYEVRKELGRILARKYAGRVGDVDLVMASPDSGRGVAIGFQQELSKLTGRLIPYEEAAIKNPGAKRTFQVEDEVERKLAARLKFFINGSVVNGKKVAVGDDSIVRGTVFRDGMIYKLRRAGAIGIYPVISCPPLVYSCIKNPRGQGFAAYGLEGNPDIIGEKVAQKINADFVCYPSEEDMRQALGLEDICASCVNGCYPIKEEFWR